MVIGGINRTDTSFIAGGGSPLKSSVLTRLLNALCPSPCNFVPGQYAGMNYPSAQQTNLANLQEAVNTAQEQLDSQNNAVNEAQTTLDNAQEQMSNAEPSANNHQLANN